MHVPLRVPCVVRQLYAGPTVDPDWHEVVVVPIVI